MGPPKPRATFATPLAREVYRFVSTLGARPPAAGGVSPFTRGRMSYEFDLDPLVSKDIPTTVLHSLDEGGPADVRARALCRPLDHMHRKHACALRSRP